MVALMWIVAAAGFAVARAEYFPKVADAAEVLVELAASDIAVGLVDFGARAVAEQVSVAIRAQAEACLQAAGVDCW